MIALALVAAPKEPGVVAGKKALDQDLCLAAFLLIPLEAVNLNLKMDLDLRVP